MAQVSWRSHHPQGGRRVLVTKELPGERWLERLVAADCAVEVCTSEEMLGEDALRAAIGSRCDGVIGQLTEPWGEPLFAALKAAGGRAFSNYAVGYNNVDVDAATRHGIAVGNTPGVLTETTAELTVALTLAAARRVVEADAFLRAGRYRGWLPTLFLGERLRGKTVGVVGAGRIGAAYARMMVEGFKLDLLYCDPRPNAELEDYLAHYAELLRARGEPAPRCERVQDVDALLPAADIVSLHPLLDASTHHLIDARRLARMKPNAILVNASRGPVIDEAALVEHCQTHPEFRVGLDVFEDEPALAPGLAELPNAVLVPHIASATGWTREGMAILAATNVAAVLCGQAAWAGADVLAFLDDPPPAAAPSIVNADALGLATVTQE